MKGINIRRMKESDLDAVPDLSILANPHAVKEKYRVNLIRWLNEFEDLAFVAEKDGSVVGYVMGETSNDMAWIQDIAVAPQQQGKGVGNKLLQKELEALTKRKPKTVIVEVHWKNAAAIPFYYQNGFRMSGLGRNRFGIGHDAIFLELDISGSR